MFKNKLVIKKVTKSKVRRKNYLNNNITIIDFIDLTQQ